MTKYHVKSNGEIGVCRAVKRPCPLTPIPSALGERYMGAGDRERKRIERQIAQDQQNMQDNLYYSEKQRKDNDDNKKIIDNYKNDNKYNKDNNNSNKAAWEQFEEDATRFLNNKYGNYFEHQGASDSTVSDILYNNPNTGESYYIESKMSNAQSGQFVLKSDNDNEQFIFSNNNKKDENNKYINDIINHMNQHYNDYKNVGTNGKKIDINDNVIISCIQDMYKNKGVKKFITKDKNNNFILIPIEDFGDYFNVSATYRRKKSGSSKISKSNEKDFINNLNNIIPDTISNKNMIINNGILEIKNTQNNSYRDFNNMRIKGNKYTYLLKSINDNSYQIRQLSNTSNETVIFSINLKE